MEKKKIKLTISGNSKKTISNIEIAKSQSKNAVVIQKKGNRIGSKPSFYKKPNQKRLIMIEKEARKLLPTLGNMKSTWLGFRPTLPDALPVIGQSEKNKNVFYAFGHQHIGWTLGAVTGKVIMELVQNRKPNIDISAFSPSRFN